MRAEEKIQRNTIQATTNFWTIISKLLFGIVGWNKKLKIFWRIRSEIDANTFNVRKKLKSLQVSKLLPTAASISRKTFFPLLKLLLLFSWQPILLLSRFVSSPFIRSWTNSHLIVGWFIISLTSTQHLFKCSHNERVDVLGDECHNCKILNYPIKPIFRAEIPEIDVSFDFKIASFLMGVWSRLSR